MLRLQGTCTGTNGMVGIMSGPRIPLLMDEIVSVDETDEAEDFEVLVNTEQEGDDSDGGDGGECDSLCWDAEALVMVIEEEEGKDKEGRRRGWSTSIFSSTSPPVFEEVVPETNENLTVNYIKITISNTP